ncbi:arginine deiminase family protein [Lentibacillus saliphilus]|uniref:arginine deiminase family protein n=1 Tax=Lentibacillus saliphilus TaxID=2737028 RepID=UPI001C2F6CE9|nr:arginine deiminase family protein [Lentibacillus saliphilus]
MRSINPSCWSEHDELDIVMVCKPTELSIPNLQLAAEVQWNAPVHHEKAQENFRNLTIALKSEGIRVIDYSDLLSQEDQQLSRQLINRFFVRDLACVFGEQIVPGVAGTFMRAPEYDMAHRLMERSFARDTFVKWDDDAHHPLEFGDVLVLNKDAVLINAGLRTSIEGIYKVKDDLFQAGFSEIGVMNLPRRTDTLHLDMNCNVAGDGIVVAKIFMRHFPVKVLTKGTVRYGMFADFLKQHGFEVHWLERYNTIPDINFLNLSPDTILISQNADQSLLKSHPMLQHKRIISIDVTELEKAGGGIRCMTLPLKRK